VQLHVAADCSDPLVAAVCVCQPVYLHCSLLSQGLPLIAIMASESVGLARSRGMQGTVWQSVLQWAVGCCFVFWGLS
jgi:hypothetical protein